MIEALSGALRRGAETFPDTNDVFYRHYDSAIAENPCAQGFAPLCTVAYKQAHTIQET
jgi:hypothetical protein